MVNTAIEYLPELITLCLPGSSNTYSVRELQQMSDEEFDTVREQLYSIKDLSSVQPMNYLSIYFTVEQVAINRRITKIEEQLKLI